jgi:hypothetical protein
MLKVPETKRSTATALPQQVLVAALNRQMRKVVSFRAHQVVAAPLLRLLLPLHRLTHQQRVLPPVQPQRAKVSESVDWASWDWLELWLLFLDRYE